MVNRRLDPTRMLSLIRKLARKKGLTVKELPDTGSNGSHVAYALVNEDGNHVARFGLSIHPGDLSRGLMHKIENDLKKVLGEKWTEKR